MTWIGGGDGSAVEHGPTVVRWSRSRRRSSTRMVVGMSSTRMAGGVQPRPAARTNLWGSATGVAEGGGGGSAPAEGDGVPVDGQMG